ncbi:hypothetical protein HDU89_005452 [Geranomyces variabilis]|nr:hypothetical protein HDU89_005452 [Geranomyces variabilis]
MTLSDSCFTSGSLSKEIDEVLGMDKVLAPVSNLPPKDPHRGDKPFAANFRCNSGLHPRQEADEFDIGAGIEGGVISRLKKVAKRQEDLDKLLNNDERVVAMCAKWHLDAKALGAARAAGGDDIKDAKECLEAAEKEL